MRFGILTVDGIFPKSLRDRRPHWIVPAILPPRYEVRSSNVNELVLPCGGSLDLDGGADLLELLLHVGRLRLGNLLLHRLGGAVHEILGLLEAQSGELAHHLDDLDLLVARRVQDHVELCLLLGCSRAGRRRATRARGAPPPPPADTPHFPCKRFESWAASSSVSPSSFSAISSMFVAICPRPPLMLLIECVGYWTALLRGPLLASALEHANELTLHGGEQRDDLPHGALHRAHDLRAEGVLRRQIRERLERRRLQDLALDDPHLDGQGGVVPHE